MGKMKVWQETVAKIVVALCVCVVGLAGALFFFGCQDDNPKYEYVLLEDGTYAIQSVEKLEEVDKLILPNTYKGEPVSAINSNAFEANLSLVEIIIPENVKRIEKKAFYGCENMVSIDLGGVEFIGEEAFANCGLQEIVLPVSLKEMGAHAFYNCKKLKNITFNAMECKDLANTSNVFKGCGEEAGFGVKFGNEVKRIPTNLLTSTYKTWDYSKEALYRTMYQQYVGNQLSNGLYFGTSANVMPFAQWVMAYHSQVKYQSLNVTEIVFSQGSQCQEIGQRAFYGTNIESITFPSSLTVIEAQAVGGCDKISEIVFEDAKAWVLVGAEDKAVDFSDETENVGLLVSKYANYKLQKAE